MQHSRSPHWKPLETTYLALCTIGRALHETDHRSQAIELARDSISLTMGCRPRRLLLAVGDVEATQAAAALAVAAAAFVEAVVADLEVLAAAGVEAQASLGREEKMRPESRYF
jgi:hypothetical protein